MHQLNQIDALYAANLEHIMEMGTSTPDRTGVGIRECFGDVYLGFEDTSASFPILSLKRTNYEAAIDEMGWMLSGSTNIHDLKSSIWNEWADEHGDLGPTYGAQLRAFRNYRYGDDGIELDSYIDQVARFMVGIVQNPTSRRHLITLVHPGDEAEQALPPCISLVQGRVLDGNLHLAVYQRSADFFLGVPFDVVGWAFFQHLMAAWAQLRPASLHFHYGSAHLYQNHMEQANTVLARYYDWVRSGARPDDGATPPRLRLHNAQSHGTEVTEAVAELWLEKAKDIRFSVSGYDPMPAIKAPVAV